MRMTTSLIGTATDTFEGCNRLAGPADVGVLMQGALWRYARAQHSDVDLAEALTCDGLAGLK